jgi:hypothetical protein
MANTKQNAKVSKKKPQELDSVYLLKLVLYMILGAQWLRFTKGSMTYPIPAGFFIGVIFASHDHFRIDRKVEYALLLVSTFIAFWLPLGFEIVIK